MSTSETVVIADSSPFIHLDRIGRLDLLPMVFGDVTVPEIVANEVGRGEVNVFGIVGIVGINLRILSWVSIVPDRMDPDIAADGALHQGEVAALSLARAKTQHLLIIDDLAGRKAAQRLGLRFIGTAGAVIRARKAGLIPSAAQLFDDLAADGFRLAEPVRRNLLALVGE